jgi:hypothetical protein
MSSKSDAYQKEMDAQRARAKARAHLEATGCGPSAFESIANSQGIVKALGEKKNLKSSHTTDNTLDLLMKRKISESQTSNESVTKNSIIQQQTELRKQIEIKQSNKLPIGWEAVVDKTSGDTYYWNKTTGETTWEKPVCVESKTDTSSDDLPPGWVEVFHSATNQKYYIHQGTSEKKWTRPSINDDKQLSGNRTHNNHTTEGKANYSHTM